MDLVYKNEKVLKVVSLIISALAWAAILYFSKGLVLIYVLLFGLIYLFAQSALIAHIKGTGVRVAADQYVDLHERFEKCCQQIGLERAPQCFVLRTNSFNALDTRFLGRNFVVLFADVLDALKDNPAALSFYMGHELGHLRRKHLLWKPLLLPSSFLPLLGAAYHRACEYTCDRHGLACSENAVAAQHGLLAIATANTRVTTTSAAVFARQVEESTGFWMSFHELIGDYPWLAKRVNAINALGSSAAPAQPGRNFFAWLLALFVPRLGIAASAGAGALLPIAIIGILAAIAIPAYQDYANRAQIMIGLTRASSYQTAVAAALARNGGRFEGLDNQAISLPSAVNSPPVESIRVVNAALVITYSGTNPSIAGQRLVLVPEVTSSGTVVWVCGHAGAPAGARLPVTDYPRYTTFPDKLLPAQCRAGTATH